MNIKRMFPPLLILSFLIFESTQTSSAIVPDNGPSVTGAGEFFNPSPPRAGLYEFSLDVSANKHDRAHGRAIFDNLTAGTHIEIRVDCLNGSTLTGTILHSTDPQLPKGTGVVFAAEDNSSLPFPFPDIISLVFPKFNPEGDCHDNSPPLTFFFLPGDAITFQP